MAPISTNDVEGATSITNVSKGSLPKQPSSKAKFDIFRRLVPVVADGTVTHLNAGFMPPSNLVTHEAISQFCTQWLHSPSPKHSWRQIAEEVRVLLAQYINTDPSCLAFTRDTTEAMSYFMHSLNLQPGDNVVILDCEHPNQAYGWLSLRSLGVEVRQVPTESEANGFATAANANTFADHVDDRTRAIGISSIMFHSGQWNDVSDICAAYRPRGIHVLADLTQQVGFADVDVQELGVSAAAFSLHKGLNSPLGLAALYVHEDFIRDLDPIPPIVGYGSVRNTSEDFMIPNSPIGFHPSARRYEHANMNLLAASAARAFLQFYLDIMGPEEVKEHLYTLGDALREKCEQLGVEVLGPSERRSHAPHLYILKLYEDKWEEHFKQHDVAVTVYRWGVRVSFGFYSSLDDVQRLADVIQYGLDAGFQI
ncbi:pyridoxal phosphate-dependent transferase [Ilyonectria robusta]|uniref:pyridoxal phosphate-dependent transferase n=1 Tax=Ilyonectria robusta TaxID=1079257 RepID=UPI001E8D7BE3|nr:pyridoxal phosphate-dependent transferase [Ilyonectria robusta]KAH8729813.1 pyridoxal phosphate-dependent transferase [Ilyonectria robusta]